MSKQCKVKRREFLDAFSDSGEHTWYYVDTETGEIIWVFEEVRLMLEKLLDKAESSDDVRKMIAERDVPDWQKQSERESAEVLIEEYQLEWEEVGRYIQIPPYESREQYEDMCAFIETVEDDEARHKLWKAVRASKGTHIRFLAAVSAPIRHRTPEVAQPPEQRHPQHIPFVRTHIRFLKRFKVKT